MASRHNNNTPGMFPRRRNWGLVPSALLVVVLTAPILRSKAKTAKLGCAGSWCYVQHTDRVRWELARARCREDGVGRLAVIPDVATQLALSGIIKNSDIFLSIWIGARNTGNAWTWQDGRPFYGEEVDYYDHPTARCGYLYTGFRARIAAAPCNSNKKYLCSTIDGNVPARGTSLRTWYEANYDCAARQKVLPMLSQTEMQQLADRLMPDYGHDEYWVGLCRQGWIWQDTGEDVLYMNFNSQTPYCSENKCMSLNNRAEWFNEDCQSLRGFLCEIPDSSVAPPVRPTLPSPPYSPVTLRPVGTQAIPTSFPSSQKTMSVTLAPDAVHDGEVHNHGENDEEHSHAVLIGVIVVLGIVISSLIILLVLLVLRKRRGKQPEEKDNIDNIYSEIHEPPSSLPQPSNPAMDNLYLDSPTPGPSPHSSPERKPRCKLMPLPKPENLKSGCEMSTFKNHNHKRFSMEPPSVPPPDHPLSEQPRAKGACCADTTGPYAISYIACTPKDRSATLDSLAALPEAPKPSNVRNRRLVLPPPPPPPLSGNDEATHYMLPKDEAMHGLLSRERVKLGDDDTAVHGHLAWGQPRKDDVKKEVRESASLMLEENDLYSDSNVP